MRATRRREPEGVRAAGVRPRDALRAADGGGIVSQVDDSQVRLVQSAVDGDEEAFAALFNTHFQPVYNYALWLANEPALAEDLTQETFIRAYKNLPGLKSPGSFRPWLFRLARNLFIDHTRRERDVAPLEPEAPIPSPGPDPEQTVVSGEMAERVRDALGRMPEQQREALVLREFEGFAYANIAAIMDVSQGYVGPLLNRARARFKEAYGLQILFEDPLPRCDVLNDLLDSLHDGHSLAEQERFVREHVETCPTCQQRQRELLALTALFGGLPPIAPPPGLGTRILEHTIGPSGGREAARRHELEANNAQRRNAVMGNEYNQMRARSGPGPVLGLLLGVVLMLLIGVVIFLLAPASMAQAGLASFDGARASIGLNPVGGGQSGGPDAADDIGLWVPYDPQCPQSAPFRCGDDSCVLNPSMCDPASTCPPDMPLMCVDGQCVAEPEDCRVFPDCPGVTPYQCWDGACEPSPSYCRDLPLTSAGCPEGQILCGDGTCAADVNLCAVPPRPPDLGRDYFEANYMPDVIEELDPDLYDQMTAEDGQNVASLIDVTCTQPGLSECHTGQLCCCTVSVGTFGGGDHTLGNFCFRIPSTGVPPAPEPAPECPADWFVCGDGTCVATQTECPAPPVSVPPADGGSGDGADGSMCGDGICQAGESADWCGDCAPGGVPGSPDEGCYLPFIICPDGTCALPDSCPQPTPHGPEDEAVPGGNQCLPGYYQCWDGSCAPAVYDCPAPPSSPGDFTS